SDLGFGQGLFFLAFFGLIFVFSLFAGDALRLGFFHGLLGFGRTLGTSFGALLALFFLQLFAAEKLDECFVGAIALLPASADNAQVTAFAIAEARTNSVEELVHGGAGHEVGVCLPARRKVATLAQSDHLLHSRTHGLGLRHRRLDTFFENERRHQIPQQ